MLATSGVERRRRSRPVQMDVADHDLTVIVPAFNEGQRLPQTLAGLARYLDAWGVDYRVLVVDDGSSDGTASLTDASGPRFSTIRLPQRRGKGHAVQFGMLRATGRILAFTDADLPYDLSALRQGYEWIRAGTCDVVFGARDLDPRTRAASRRVSRRVATFVFRELVKRLVSREVVDTQCGLKLFSRRAACALFSRTKIAGFAFDAELVFLTQVLRIPFRRIAVTLINEHSSTVSLARHAVPMLLDILALRWRSWRGGVRGTARGRLFELPALRTSSSSARCAPGRFLAVRHASHRGGPKFPVDRSRPARPRRLMSRCAITLNRFVRLSVAPRLRTRD